MGAARGRQIPVHSFTRGLALPPLDPVPSCLLLLQFLGRFETVVFYWPSLLCLSFLLGRFLHMFVRSLRAHLGWELQTVSTEQALHASWQVWSSQRSCVAGTRITPPVL